MSLTKEQIEEMSDKDWLQLKEEIFNPDYWEDLEHATYGAETIDKAWEEVDKADKPKYSEEYMWDVANQFGSYGEYMEYLENMGRTQEAFKVNEEYFQYHHLI